METKMIFLDLDGTLLNDVKEIPKVNVCAIDEAVRRGHKVLICSGRPLSSVIKLLPDFGLDRPGCYAISYNGGLIYDAGEKRSIYKKTLPLEQVRYVFESAYAYGKIHIQTYTEEAFICEYDTPESHYYAKMTQCDRKVVKDVFEELGEQEPCKVLAIAHGFDRERLEGFREKIGFWANGKMDVCFSCREYLEFMPPGIDKGNAVRFMADYLKIPLEHTIAVGDEENDISMLQAAGIGAVMKNAGDKIKKYGDYITEADNNEGGVAEVIEKFMLSERV